MKFWMLLAAAFAAFGALARAQNQNSPVQSPAPAAAPAKTHPQHSPHPRRTHVKSLDPAALALNKQFQTIDDGERSSLQGMAAQFHAGMLAIYNDPSLSDAQRAAKLDALRKNDSAQHAALYAQTKAARKSAVSSAAPKRP